LYTGWPCEVLTFGLTNSPSSGHGRDHVSSSEVIDNISEMVQDRDIVTMKGWSEIMYGLSNGMIANDLE